MDSLPIDAVLPAIRSALEGSSGLVLQAPPGAGKTTGVPLALLDAAWLAGGKIVMLEPRRLAARAAAARMAQTLGESVGQTVGYRIRQDSKVGPATRIEVVTEGILTRMLQDDAGLPGIGLVIFDEFHERSLNADLGLALCLEAQGALRDDLKLLVMSATLDGGPVAQLMGGVPLVTSEGRAFPVQTRFLARPEPRKLPDAMAAAIRRALAEDDGDLLAFLPGSGEIRRTEALLAADPALAGMVVAPLYGDLDAQAQDRAIRRDGDGRRKVVLATAIAETSLTIDGVAIVIDGGQMRVPRFDASTGMTRLVTLPVSRAAADQRRGRAGRQGPGVCWRLWSEAEDRALVAFTAPEIADADLAPLALDLAQWGIIDAGQLAWLEPPPASALAQGRELLAELGAIDKDGRITAHGRAMNRLAMHPRLAHMVMVAKDQGLGGLACDLAALLSERDIVRPGREARDSDMRLRLDLLKGGREGAHMVDRGGLARVRQTAKDWRRRLGIRAGEDDGGQADCGPVLALAYPDRIAKRRPGGEPRYALSSGGGAHFAQYESLAAEDWLVAAETDGDRREARIFLAAPLTLADIETQFEGAIRTVDEVGWDRRDEVVVARRARKLFALTLDDRKLTQVPSDRLVQAMAEGIRAMGLESLPWTDELQKYRARIAFLRAHRPDDGWPDLSDQALLEGLETWLAPYLSGITRRAHLARLDLAQALRDMLEWEQSRRLDDVAPTHVTVPSGSRVPIDYSGEIPVLAVRLQEMFGCADTPRIAGGAVPLLLHLLSPARRPVQVTRDLASFWANTYHAVKADLKGQYPKHWWPDDPMQAEPTARAKPRK
ncbi:ATP-dependent helicase HrpB [Magnetospirillum moscoviense]|uniref:ATP-dependent helicase HrpB n=1 Tax=Magnetospirillum moscoviense TaxID=1437059 RepID=A0A178MK66_9PROT|nr:ATP-dependent helicase HrpB [Magnetospirillum moscoviense]OAN48435.1 ATP-dependent helicase HrpB [Magnetospirillum moscoviense]